MLPRSRPRLREFDSCIQADDALVNASLIARSPEDFQASRHKWALGKGNSSRFGIEVRQQEGLGRLVEASALKTDVVWTAFSLRWRS